MTARRWTPRARAALRALARRCLDAYAETAWVYRYGPGFAPTAPVRFDAAAAPAARARRTYVARDARPLGSGPRPGGAAPTGFRAAGRRARQTPASRSPAHASASA